MPRLPFPRLSCLPLLGAALLVACGGRSTPPEPTAPSQAAAAPFTGHLLVGESPQALHSWTLASEAVRERGAGLLDEVVFGQKAFVRLAVTRFEPADPFVADGTLRLLSPEGETLYEQTTEVGEAQVDPEAPGVLVFAPGIDIIFDPGDPTGTYRIVGTMRSGEHSLELTRELRVEGRGLPIDPNGAI